MQKSEYFLILDTETSGIPKNWLRSTKKHAKWPFLVQIAWQIRDLKGTLIKKEMFYLKPRAGQTIPQKSIEIHGITQDFAENNGINPKSVLEMLNQDILRFTPTLVAHCVTFDQKVISAAMHSQQLTDYISGIPSICTMESSAHFVGLPNNQAPSLALLYKKLFDKVLKNEHDAANDCQAAYDCFVALKEKEVIKSHFQIDQ